MRMNGAWLLGGMAGFLSCSLQFLWYFYLWGGGVGTVEAFSLELLELVSKLEVGKQLTGTALSSKGLLFVFF